MIQICIEFPHAYVKLLSNKNGMKYVIKIGIPKISTIAIFSKSLKRQRLFHRRKAIITHFS